MSDLDFKANVTQRQRLLQGRLNALLRLLNLTEGAAQKRNKRTTAVTSKTPSP